MSDNKKNRDELKNFFRKGNVPTEEHFALLIDSMVNIIDDKPLFVTDMPEKEKPKEDNTDEKLKPEQASKDTVDEHSAIPADGDWYQLPIESAIDKDIDGCRIYRIYASYYDKRKDTYGMCVVTASHCSGKDRKIKSPQKHWWGWSGDIKIRWYYKDDQLFLQMRSKGDKEVKDITYRIEEIWNFTNSV